MEAVATKAGEALAKVMAERDTLAKNFESARAELANKGVTMIVEVDKAKDGQPPAPEAEPTTSEGILAKVETENPGLDKETLAKIAAARAMRVAMKSPRVLMKM